VERIVYIGKESNRLEEVESGMVQDEASVYTEYPDPRRDEWHTTVLAMLKNMRLSDLVKKSGMSRRAILDLRAGRSRPHLRNEVKLKAVLNRLNRRLEMRSGYLSYTARTFISGSDFRVPTRRTPCLYPRLMKL
jgi:hypothetical protein